MLFSGSHIRYRRNLRNYVLHLHTSIDCPKMSMLIQNDLKSYPCTDSVYKMFFTTSDILTNIFLINAGHFCTRLDMLIINKAEVFSKAQLKMVKLTSRMLAYVRQMQNISSVTNDWRLFVNTARNTFHHYH